MKHFLRCLLFIISVQAAFAGASGSATAILGNTLSWHFEYNASTKVVTATFVHAGGFDPNWYGGQYACSVIGAIRCTDKADQLFEPKTETLIKSFAGVEAGSVISGDFSGRHSNGNSLSYTPNTFYWVVSAPVAQTLTHNFTGAIGHEAGETIFGQASGAQAGNQYNFSISGSASISGNSATGVFSITAGEVGAGGSGSSYTASLWVSGGNGYAASSDVHIDGTVIDTKVNKVTIRLDNRGNLGQVFHLKQDGVRFTSFALASDEVRVVTVEAPTLSPVIVETQGNHNLVDGVWVSSPPVVTQAGAYAPERVGGGVIPPEMLVPATGGPTPADPTPDGLKSVWTSITGDNITNNITNASFAEGAGKIVEAIKGLGSGGSGLMPSMFSSSSGIDDVEDEETEIEGFDGATMPTLVGDALGKLPTAPQIIMPDASSPVFVSPHFTLGDIDLQAEYDMSAYIGVINPFRIFAGGCISIFFFISYVKTIKGAFAS